MIKSNYSNVCQPMFTVYVCKKALNELYLMRTPILTVKLSNDLHFIPLPLDT